MPGLGDKLGQSLLMMRPKRYINCDNNNIEASQQSINSDDSVEETI